jgi:hypothetical protein
MKCIPLLLLLAGTIVPVASAQDHGQVSVYADYFRLNETKTNFAGLGGRLAFGGRWLQWESEVNYDFTQAFTEGFTDTGTGSVTLVRSNLRVLRGLFGPKLQAGGAIRPFVTLKGGFINFRFDPRPATFATFASSVEDLRANDVKGVLYPGGGLEGHLGPVGLRLDLGDEIYFANGAHHNFRLAFGPIIRF